MKCSGLSVNRNTYLTLQRSHTVHPSRDSSALFCFAGVARGWEQGSICPQRRREAANRRPGGRKVGMTEDGLLITRPGITGH